MSRDEMQKYMKGTFLTLHFGYSYNYDSSNYSIHLITIIDSAAQRAHHFPLTDLMKNVMNAQELRLLGCAF